MNNVLAKTALVVGLIGICLPRAAAEDKAPSAAEAQFQRAFYLHVHEHDLAGAAAAYEKAAADASASESLRGEARTRLAQVREDMAVTNFAQLMPSDVLGYAELVEPGEHIERMLKMMGLVHAAGVARRTSRRSRRCPLGDGLVLAGRLYRQPGAWSRS